MDGYIKSTDLSASVGLSERRVKEIAREAHLEYIAVKPTGQDGYYWLPEKDAYAAIISAGSKVRRKRRKGAKEAAAKRAGKGNGAAKKKRAAAS